MANRSKEVKPIEAEEDVVASPPQQPGVKNRVRILQEEKNCEGKKRLLTINTTIGDKPKEKKKEAAQVEPKQEDNKKEEPMKEEKPPKEPKKLVISEEDLDEVD